jgi:hypothetical protein
MQPQLWYYDLSKQALIFFDPERNGQGIGFHLPAIERLGLWEPRGQLELAIRKMVPAIPGPSMIQRAAGLPPQGFPPNARRR